LSFFMMTRFAYNECVPFTFLAVFSFIQYVVLVSVSPQPLVLPRPGLSTPVATPVSLQATPAPVVSISKENGNHVARSVTLHPMFGTAEFHINTTTYQASLPKQTLAPRSKLKLPSNFTFLPQDIPRVVNGVPQVNGTYDGALAPSHPKPNSVDAGSSAAKNSTSNHTLAVNSFAAAADTYWLANIAHGNHPNAPPGFVVLPITRRTLTF
jgi:hypothetical protein